MLEKIPIESLKIAAMEKALFVHGEDVSAGINIKEHFCDTTYLKQMDIKAGLMVTGKLHKTAHLSILAKGKMIINHGDGRIETLEAPSVIKTMAYTKRLGICLEDATYINIFNNVDNLKGKELDDYFTVPTEEAMKQLGISL